LSVSSVFCLLSVHFECCVAQNTELFIPVFFVLSLPLSLSSSCGLFVLCPVAMFFALFFPVFFVFSFSLCPLLAVSLSCSYKLACKNSCAKLVCKNSCAKTRVKLVCKNSCKTRVQKLLCKCCPIVLHEVLHTNSTIPYLSFADHLLPITSCCSPLADHLLPITSC
jgi:hypothetical protein